MKKIAVIPLGIALAAVLAVVVVAHSSSSTAPAAGTCQPGDRTLRISVGGDSHEALLHIPPGARGRLPLVLAFHGAYDDARFTSVYFGLSRVADREHFAVLYPQA